MKKNISNYKLNRDTTSRKALFKSLMQSMILRESIHTTYAKAMAVKPQFEKMITKAKSAKLHELRLIQGILQNPNLLKKLVQDIALRYKNVNGGYTKITPLGNRRGDNAKIVKFSLTKLATSANKSDSTNVPSEPKTAPTAKPKVTKLKPQTVVSPSARELKTLKLATKRSGRRGDK